MLRRRSVSGTDKGIVNVLALNKTVVVGQLRVAVGAVEQSGQTVGAAAPLGRSAHGFPQTLDCQRQRENVDFQIGRASCRERV